MPMRAYASTVCRMVISVLLVEQVVAFIQPEFGPAALSGLSGGISPLAAGFLAALMLLAAVWLFLGVCSRIMALWTVTAQSALISFGEGVLLDAVFVGALALPVMVFGGGAYALYRRGWDFGV